MPLKLKVKLRRRREPNWCAAFFFSISYFFKHVQPAMCNSWQLSSATRSLFFLPGAVWLGKSKWG
jgi:hypothetical protein